jgi:hypothetical protein
MKNIHYIIIILALVFASSCQDSEFRTHYPESFPSLTASVAENSIQYGDSITLTADVSDTNPLSTLEVKIAVSNRLIISESIRTKGNTASITKKYHIPFGVGMPDKEKVKVYLTAINVEGFKTEMLIDNTIGNRPEIQNLYLIPSTITSGLPTKELILTDSENLIYSVSGIEFPNKFSCYVASKKTAFGRVDWSGVVFGTKSGEITLVEQGEDPILVEDESLVNISSCTFDAINFRLDVAGKPFEPLTFLDVNVDLTLSPSSLLGSDAKQFRGATLYFGQDVEVSFTGIANLSNGLAPDYFEITGENKAKFLGETGMYKAYYHIAGDYLYIEPMPTVEFPDALWICGMGMGRPSQPYAITTSWNWNTPLDYVPCRKISNGVYQATVYLENEDNTEGTGFGTCNFKFFHYRGWDHGEESSIAYTIGSPLKSSAEAGNVGNWRGSDVPFKGVYRITLDVNAKTTEIVKID